MGSFIIFDDRQDYRNDQVLAGQFRYFCGGEHDDERRKKRCSTGRMAYVLHPFL